jgi:hypothetical protein
MYLPHPIEAPPNRRDAGRPTTTTNPTAAATSAPATTRRLSYGQQQKQIDEESDDENIVHPFSSDDEEHEHEEAAGRGARVAITYRRSTTAVDDVLDRDFDAFPLRRVPGNIGAKLENSAGGRTVLAFGQVVGAVASALLRCLAFIAWWMALAALAHHVADRYILLNRGTGRSAAKPRVPPPSATVQHVLPWFRTPFASNRSIFTSHPVTPLATEPFDDYGPFPRSVLSSATPKPHHPHRQQRASSAADPTPPRSWMEAAWRSGLRSWPDLPTPASGWRWRNLRDGTWVCSYAVCTARNLHDAADQDGENRHAGDRGAEPGVAVRPSGEEPGDDVRRNRVEKNNQRIAAGAAAAATSGGPPDGGRIEEELN